MKKLLRLLASTALVATTSATVVACGDETGDTVTQKDLATITGTNLNITVSDNLQATAETVAIEKIKTV
ncbi:lipoprotein [Spiroplasma taiwanense]|uniref:lipoprotein n=1 Tax=Spiroplasma taiwanense TaxID=2145 RepID=UPI00146B04C0